MTDFTSLDSNLRAEHARRTSAGMGDESTIFSEAADAIAQLTRENERLAREREAILQQTRIWALEAKSQKATVDDVGAVLGGIEDWGPIAAGVEKITRARDAAVRDLADQQNKHACALRLLKCDDEFIAQNTRALSASNQEVKG